MKTLIKNLRVFKILSSDNRISSIDIFRSIAIISVVIFHFNMLLPYGYIGVDLFFVISGFLIGGILTKEFNNGEPINYFKFIIQRGFKVWPSYYFFLAVGTILAYLFYHTIAPNQLIPFWDMKRYLLFYQNYTGQPFHWCFDHVWSLCVEEHFYILLPIIFIATQKTVKRKSFLFSIIGLMVIAGFVSKILMLYYSHSKDTYSATNNRIDELAWGVILNFIIIYRGDALKKFKHTYLLFITGVLLFVLVFVLEIYLQSVFFQKVLFHSLLPICLVMIIASVYYYDFSKLKILRIIAYYSYNWYLWHPIFVIFIINHVGFNVIGLIIYIIISFIFAVLVTIFVEEKVLSKRNIFLSKFN